MPLIQVQLLSGRTPEQKEQFMREVAEVAQRVLLVPDHAVTITLTEVPDAHWSVGGRTVRR